MQRYKGFSFNIFKAEETRKYKHVNSGMNVGIYAGECCKIEFAKQMTDILLAHKE